MTTSAQVGSKKKGPPKSRQRSSVRRPEHEVIWTAVVLEGEPQQKNSAAGSKV